MLSPDLLDDHPSIYLLTLIQGMQRCGAARVALAELVEGGLRLKVEVILIVRSAYGRARWDDAGPAR